MRRLSASCCAGLLLVAAASPPVFAMGRWPEPSIDKETEKTITSMEGTITGLNLKSEPPVIRVVSKTDKRLVLMMDAQTTAVWIEEKLKSIRHLKLGDGIKLYYVVHGGKGLVTSIEVLTRAAPKKKDGSGGLADDLKALKKRPSSPPKPPAAPIINAPATAAPIVRPPAAVPIPRPPTPGTTSKTTERRPVR